MARCARDTQYYQFMFHVKIKANSLKNEMLPLLICSFGINKHLMSFIIDAKQPRQVENTFH